MKLNSKSKTEQRHAETDAYYGSLLDGSSDGTESHIDKPPKKARRKMDADTAAVAAQRAPVQDNAAACIPVDVQEGLEALYLFLFNFNRSA